MVSLSNHGMVSSVIIVSVSMDEPKLKLGKRDKEFFDLAESDITVCSANGISSAGPNFFLC